MAPADRVRKAPDRRSTLGQQQQRAVAGLADHGLDPLIDPPAARRQRKGNRPTVAPETPEAVAILERDPLAGSVRIDDQRLGVAMLLEEGRPRAVGQVAQAGEPPRRPRIGQVDQHPRIGQSAKSSAAQGCKSRQPGEARIVDLDRPGATQAHPASDIALQGEGCEAHVRQPLRRRPAIRPFIADIASECCSSRKQKSD